MAAPATAGANPRHVIDGPVDIRVGELGANATAYLTAAKFAIPEKDTVFPLIGLTEGDVTQTFGKNARTRTPASMYTGRVDLTVRDGNSMMIAGNFAQVSPEILALVLDEEQVSPGVWAPRDDSELTYYSFILDAPAPGGIYRYFVPAGQFTEDSAIARGIGTSTQIPFTIRAVKQPGKDLWVRVFLATPAPASN